MVQPLNCLVGADALGRRFEAARLPGIGLRSYTPAPRGRYNGPHHHDTGQGQEILVRASRWEAVCKAIESWDKTARLCVILIVSALCTIAVIAATAFIR